MTSSWSGADNPQVASVAHQDSRQSFGDIRSLRNHWSRPPGPSAYYWYLTFERCRQLHAAASQCQKAIAFPYYDLVPVHNLHLTLDRVAPRSAISSNLLNDIETAGRRVCRDIAPFNLAIGGLSGTRGAIGFTTLPEQPISDLRNALRQAVHSLCPNTPAFTRGAAPHITLAYANSDGIGTTEVMSVVERLNVTTLRVEIPVREVALVLLARNSRSYSWQICSHIPLG